MCFLQRGIHSPENLRDLLHVERGHLLHVHLRRRGLGQPRLQTAKPENFESGSDIAGPPTTVFGLATAGSRFHKKSGNRIGIREMIFNSNFHLIL